MTKPLTFLPTKPNLMPLVVELSPPASSPPLIRPAAATAWAVAAAGTVRRFAGVKPELATRSEPLPIVPSDWAMLSTSAKFTPSVWFCSRSTLTMTASTSTWIGATSIWMMTSSMALRLAL